MKPTLFFIIFLSCSFPALAAKNKDHWYKVESKKTEKETKPDHYYPYDSVEKDAQKRSFKEIGFWSLRPKIGLSLGFHADKAVFKDSKSNRSFLDSKIYFYNQPWYRVTLNVQILQSNSAFLGGSLEYTPSRESSRNYYGVGVSHLLVSEKEFSNLVEPDSYYLTATVGREILLKTGHAWFFESKGFWSGNNYAIQLALGYIIPF